MSYGYYFRGADEATKRAVWNKGTVVANYDPDTWRTDKCGAWMYYPAHGDRDAKYGWEIDHIFPKALGGSDYLSNLQPLHWANNAAKGDDPAWYCGK
jgi:5-methylcytosine-specific restriction endonuclease McrA